MTVRVDAGLPAGKDAGERDVMAGPSPVIVKFDDVDGEPVGFATTTCAVPAVTSCAAETVAVIWVELTNCTFDRFVV